MTDRAPAPALGFAIGIVGHRGDRIECADGVGERIGEIIRTVSGSLDKAEAEQTYRGGRSALRLVTALAEGADRIAAHVALEQGLELEVVLPFEPREYCKDFAEEVSRVEFEGLLQHARYTLVLDGRADERARAYEAAGLSLLDNIDLLVAVWDGGPGRGRGGTREVVEDAARRAVPVVVISPDGAFAVVRSGGARAGPLRFEDLPEIPLVELSVLVETIVASPGDAFEQAHWQQLTRLPPEPLVHGAYPLLLKLAFVRPWFTPRKAEQAARPSEDPLTRAFNWWDTAAIRAAQAFRSAVIVNFTLAALAVALAAGSLLAGQFKWLFVLAEVVTIVLLLANAWHAERRDWQKRWLEAREAAELLRVCAMMRCVGIGRGISGLGRGGFASWYAGAFSRSMHLEEVDLFNPVDASAPLIAEIQAQVSWNAATAKRLHLAAHRIERFGEVLFAIVLVAAIGWLCLYFSTQETAEAFRFVLTAITAGLPAIATASYGVRVILDFEGTANRAGRISSSLLLLLKQWESGPRTATALQEFARQTASIMLGDVSAWRLLAEGRKLNIPG